MRRVVLVQVLERQQQRGRAPVDDLLPERVVGQPVRDLHADRHEHGQADPRRDEPEGDSATAARGAGSKETGRDDSSVGMRGLSGQGRGAVLDAT